ncbi:GNAT family N-acetyltransferase [Vibrio sp. D404a]|uniref:GNAT family N-acetyltransferase n=1 Tax=unclassified Vibrio TaxID=2614977 RepID=UPI002555F8C0|nr:MULTISPECIES: GNAT family N-acetyltransferase [unclassified Vibrio]MDK9736018.1 GNAT family N-acetyltransferase [Vibrio sp. D404a]MDK9797816.1 GNAT family N-acetyltransferase [Vibrio sp. D449a]
MEIIRFQAQHQEATAQLYFESRVATFSFLDTGAYCLADFMKDTDGEETWIAMEQGKVIGFVSIWRPDNFIHHLFVSPKKLKQGIGVELLNHAKELCGSLTLKCLVQNSNAIQFYLSQGFKILKTVRDAQNSYHLMSFETQT